MNEEIAKLCLDKLQPVRQDLCEQIALAGMLEAPEMSDRLFRSRSALELVIHLLKKALAEYEKQGAEE